LRVQLPALNLIVNLKTANVLGLEALTLADDVID
jgi:hypothetical protein